MYNIFNDEKITYGKSIVAYVSIFLLTVVEKPANICKMLHHLYLLDQHVSDLFTDYVFTYKVPYFHS